MKQRRKKTKVLQCSTKKRCPTARSGYLFSCLITCLHGYKIGHEKQINKVLFPCVDTLPFGSFGTAGTILETEKVNINHSNFY